MVYPTFLATVAENTHPHDRAKSLGIFRLWRDMGYAIGAILTGAIADFIGLNASILFIGILTLASGMIIYYRMKCSDNYSIKIWHWFTSKFNSNGKKAERRVSCIDTAKSMVA